MGQPAKESCLSIKNKL